MSLELNLQFPDKAHVIVGLGGEDSGALPFANPLTVKDRDDIRWYLEVYGAHSLGDPDDEEAKRIKDQLPVWGKALFDAVFADRAAARLFNRFQDSEDDTRLLNISAEHPSILSLPWELLHDSASSGVFLSKEKISIRRRVAGATGGRTPFKPEQKQRLHLLFVVSRPAGAPFIDPRADPMAVLDALEKHAPGRVTCEFLRHATIDDLVERLEDSGKPPVDILHFDGHGVFDRDGGLPELVEAKKITFSDLFSGQIVREKKAAAPVKSPPNTGYLLFEKEDGRLDFVSAQRLGENLHRHKVALIILSACQTAMLGDNDEPMGSVAARLTAAGIPAVLAMTHSVLVATTRALFGEFYKHLARGRGIGESLDNARRYLANNPEKYEVQRGPKRVSLKLDDWFLPALYQSGDDVPLLGKSEVDSQKSETQKPRSNLSGAPEAGFSGRRRELWHTERWFNDDTRRVTITGFGGQGKTALAEEAGRWLTRTGMFEAAVFVDYSRIQSRDAVAVAVSNIGSALDQTLADADAAREALAKTPTLVILDNLEALDEEPLRELLDAAVGWSEAGGSRALCTTRKPDSNHQHYRVQGTRMHMRIVLDGLGSRNAPDDALEWFAGLMKLPPEPEIEPPTREELIDLFDKVKFHPLSIRTLAQEVKTRRPEDLAKRLDQLLLSPPSVEGIPPELVASLQLSLDRLDDAARRVLPRLGVFQGGTLEDGLLAITQIGEDVWPNLRRQLETAALIEAETLPGVIVPFLRFHPTLAPMLWTQLGADEQGRLSAAHCKRYYALADHLCQADRRAPRRARSVALRELPNLLHAAHAALDEGDADAVLFANNVNLFLRAFDLRRESRALVEKASVGGEPGSQAWYLAQLNQGERFLAEGRPAEAAAVFRDVLEKLGDAPSRERGATLVHLGRCLAAGGCPDLAEQQQREAIDVLDLLEQTDDVKRNRAVCLTDLADALRDQGRYADARNAYECGLKGAGELGNLRQQGLVLAELGTLAIMEDRLDEAADRCSAALVLFQQLGETAGEAAAWHQLGVVFHKAQQWAQAEHHYRESARIEAEQDNLAGAARTWHQLALVSADAGKPEAGEMWYRKAIEADRKLGNLPGLAPGLSNLANLLQDQPGRLTEARQLAEEALAIKTTLDPGAAEIWTTHNILAQMAEKEAAATEGGDQAALRAQAREYRRLAREAKRNFTGTRHALRQDGELIVAAVAASSGHQEAGGVVAQYQAAMRQAGPDLTSLADVLDRILAGERDPDALCEGLDLQDSMIVEAILAGLSDPSTLADLLPDEADES